jgi:hypothetical protein
VYLLLGVAVLQPSLLRCLLLQPCNAGRHDSQRGQGRIMRQQRCKCCAVAEGWLDDPVAASRKVPATRRCRQQQRLSAEAVAAACMKWLAPTVPCNLLLDTILIHST